MKTHRRKTPGDRPGSPWAVLVALCAGVFATPSLPALRAQTPRGVTVVAEAPFGERIEPYRKKIALVVGIDKYKNGVRPLDVAVQDARAVYNLLRFDLGFDKVILLEDDEARRHHILHNIAQLRDETSAEDQLVFFFAGHGVSFGEGAEELAYLLPQDTEGMTASDVIPSAISMIDLRDHLVKLPPKHILLIFDACFGGYAAASPRAPRPQDQALIVSLTQYPAKQIVTAGLRGQTVVENTEWGHGALTFELLRALRDRRADSNRDRMVTATELISYLKPAVTELTEGRQTPLLASLTADLGEFVLLLPDDSPRTPGSEGIEALRGESLTEVRKRYAEAFPPDVSSDGIQAKAIITEKEATLFTDFHGEAGSRPSFLGTLFLHRGVRNGRVPVAFGPHRRHPEGWLNEGSFTVWATDRVLVPTWADKTEVFDDPRCLQAPPSPGTREACRPIAAGTESGRSNAPATAFPMLEVRGDLAKVGFVIVDPSTVAGQEAGGSARQIGYDLVVVLDTTQGMERWFEPLTKAFQRFFASIEAEPDRPSPLLRLGLLLFRDRKKSANCNIEYLVRWARELSDDRKAFIEALSGTPSSFCDSDEPAEAVLDALSRAVQDPRWNDATFKTVLLVTDAPPHSAADRDKNPLGLTAEHINQLAKERKIRFLVLKIGTQDTSELEELTARGADAAEGRLLAVEPTAEKLQPALFSVLTEEWSLLRRANQVLELGVHDSPRSRVSNHPVASPPRLASLSGAKTTPVRYVEGWVPMRASERPPFIEHAVRTKLEAAILANLLEILSLAADRALIEGPEAFVEALRTSLTEMLPDRASPFFHSDRTLEAELLEAGLLPFPARPLRFSMKEARRWKSTEKVEHVKRWAASSAEWLRDHLDDPASFQLLGDTPFIFIPPLSE